jgi:predicted metal-dependent phosphoesterase TrpH
MLFDLHVHTCFSPCSQTNPLEILYRARQMGLDGVCFTDHHSRQAANLIPEGPQEDGLVVLVGQEYATCQGDFLLFGPLPELVSGMSAPQLLEMVREAGGAAVAAHPCRSGRSLDPELADSGLIQVIEGVNGRNLVEENSLASHWGRKKGLGLVGGSDAHTLDELGSAGTEFTETIRDQSDLVRALKAGSFQMRWPLKTPIEIFMASHYAAAG